MPRGQSKTPAEKAAEAVEAQQKTVETLRASKAKYQKAIDEAKAGIAEVNPLLTYEEGILDALKRHPALGQAPVNLGQNLHEQHVHIEDALPEGPDLDITYGVETAKVEARPDAEGSVRASMLSATPTTEALRAEDDVPLDVPRSVGSSATRNPWQV